MFSCKLIKLICFLYVFLFVNTATSFAFSKEKLIKKCDEAKQEILSSTDEDKKEFIEFSKNLFITEAPQLTPSLPFSLNAPQVAPLFQKEDMQRAFDHESSQAPLLCVLKILPLIPEYSASLLPKLIDSAVLEALPREKQIAYEDSLLELSKKISQNKQNVKQETINEIGRRLKGNSFPISLLVLKDIGTLEPIAELIKDETLVDGVLKVFSIIDTKGEKIDLLHIGASQSNVTIRKKSFFFSSFRKSF